MSDYSNNIEFGLGIMFTIFMIFRSSRNQHTIDFLITAIISATFLHAQIIPHFDTSMKLFVLLANVVVAVGALVSGVVGALLPKISSGIILGSLVALFISVQLLSRGEDEVNLFASITALFVVMIVLGIYLAQKQTDLCNGLRTSLSAGLFFSLSLDSILRNGLYISISSLLSMKLPSTLCYYECFVPTLTMAWAGVAIFTFIYGYRNTLCSSGSENKASSSKQPAAGSIYKQKTFNYPDTLVVNHFDPDNTPSIMKVFAGLVFEITQRLGNQHGFQVDSSRNQAEHALMLFANEAKPGDKPVLGPISRIHAHLFANYKKWCHHMGTPPLFVKREPGQFHAAYIEDIMMFLLVWGEAANLKHAPESLCFIYHKSMEEHLSLQNSNALSKRGYVPKYPGYFLDMVVTPLFDVLAAGMKAGKDHFEKKTYDDFNEFFWSPDCLKYSIYDDQAYDPLSTSSSAAGHVARGVRTASKTYVEKRSWLHPLFSMKRIFEWHLITFSLLIAWAFSTELVWTNTFTLQATSFVLWELTFLSLIWTSLEVWVLYPESTISGPSICGYLIRLVAGYLILVYQTIYYHWSFRPDSDPNSSSLMSEGPAIFWWWQFVWLSLAAHFFYFLESILCWMPSITSTLLSWNNDFFQAVLNICYPFSQLYVGKIVHVPQKDVLRYILFWLTLLAFKLWFGFRYIVRPVTIPSIQLYDDYMNFQRISFFKTSTLMTIWWFPHFIVYLIDLSIWYSIWISVAGGYVALVERQGAVRDGRSLRSHFIRAPLAFSQKLLADDSAENLKSSGLSASTASLTNLLAPATAPRNHVTPAASKAGNALGALSKRNANKAKSSANLLDPSQFDSSDSEVVSFQNAESETLSSATVKSTLSKDINQFLSADIRSQRWILFARVWNEIIAQLRLTDHLSNSERDNFLFTTFDGLSRPVYLPLYQTAGCIESTVYAFKEAFQDYHTETEPVKKVASIERFRNSMDISAREAVIEAWELFSWIFSHLLGPAHKRDTEVLLEVVYSWARNDVLFSRINADNLNSVITHAANIISVLKGCIGKRKSSAIITPAILHQAEEIAKQKKSFDANVALGSTSNGNSSSVQKPLSKIKKSVSTGFLAGLAEMDEQHHQHQPSGGSSAAGTFGLAPSSQNKQKFTKLQPFRPQDLVITDTVRDKVRDETRNLLNAAKSALRGVTSPPAVDAQDAINNVTFIMSFESGFLWNDVYASTQIDELAKDIRSLPMLNKCNGLFKLRQTQVDPASPEATRRLNFFVNSLFMDIPVAPSMTNSKEYSCMTPYYSEDVLLTRDDLESKNSDGVSTLLYLQTLYKKDWMNFLERCGITADEQLIWSKEFGQETRMWGSVRAQTLFRTVDGMMYAEKAIRLLAKIENIDRDDIEILGKLKFNYVVACQVYGQMKKSLDHKADDIEFLLKRHPNLRVAYIDSARVNKEGDMAFYSVLIKFDPAEQIIKEVYRVKLPGNPVLGEGKPENQNHALIFSRGRYLQAIDMNQDGYFEEAIKMRNILQEFDSGCAILGFREHIFTGSISSVANYMALQELSFVTLGQRVLCNPLCIRQHYGHPDLFDKFFVMTEGGMSKASKGINLSEDVFAGFNATIRGRTVGFKEYVQVGKGRDMGLQQTYKFEAKLSQGNSEQSISRDMMRICERLDFFRLMSFYYGGIGHYMANTMVIFALVMVVYCMLGLAIYEEEGVNQRPMLPEGLLQIMLSGLGVLQTGPLAVTLTVEKGFLAALGEISYMMISGGPLYFIFHIQTKCHYFQQTLLAGGAMYRPTGRGFVIRHSPFDENYRFFAQSHIYLGFELMVALVLLAIYTSSKQYFGLTWSLWMTVVSFMLGPFWFNPVTFEWNKIQVDYMDWMRWMTETGGTSEQSWGSWWKEENSFYKGLSFAWRVFLIAQKCSIWLLIACGLLGSSFIKNVDEQQKVGEVVLLYAVFFFGNWCISQMEKRLSYGARRFSSLALTSWVLGTTVYLFIAHPVYFRFVVAIYYIGSALSFLLLVSGVTSISYVYKIHDYVVGHTIFTMIGILTTLQIGYFQTWLLYHNALSAGVVVEDILKYARKTKERALDDSNVINDLKAQVAEQAVAIKLLLEANSHKHASSLTTASGGNKAVEHTPLLSTNGFSTGSKPGHYGSGGSSVPVHSTVAASLTSPPNIYSNDLSTGKLPGSYMLNQHQSPSPPGALVDANSSASSAIPKSGISSVLQKHVEHQSKDSLSRIESFDLQRASFGLAPGGASATSLSSAISGEFVFKQPTAFPARESASQL